MLRAVPAAVATLLALVRWLVQGSGNVYTDVGKRFYVPDAALGWRLGEPGPIWLGLDVIIALAAATAAIAIAAWWLGRRGGRPRWLARALWIPSVIALAVPVAVFATGSAPDGARAQLPTEVAAPATDEVRGGIPGVPAGRYEVVAHPQTAIIAQVAAGGETFEARFSDVDGYWKGDPGDLAQPMSASFSIAVASIDTGIDGRTEHARDGYLLAQTHPRIEFSLDRVVAAAPADDGSVGFRADGTVSLMGRDHPVDVVGALRPLDANARARLALDRPNVLLIDASFSLTIGETALAPDAGDFDDPTLPIAAKLVLAP